MSQQITITTKIQNENVLILRLRNPTEEELNIVETTPAANVSAITT